MPTTALLASTGVVHVDQALRECVGLIEQYLPGRVRGYYLVGSYAYGEALPASDVDMIVLLKGEPAQADRDQFVAARGQCRRRIQLPLDLILEGEARLLRVGGVWFQTASLLLYGEDVRPRVPRKPVANHISDLMHAVFPLLARVRGNRLPLRVPIDYPTPDGPLYGYDSRHAVGHEAHPAATKDLVTNVLTAANALTLRAARQYVGSGKKSDIPRQYAIWVGDEWATLVDEVFMFCRLRWGYGLPQSLAEREHLRDLCRQTLGFENAFLERYRGMLLADLRSDDAPVRLAASRRLTQLIYPDLQPKGSA
ncbi:MAG TPA: nucleotidyltransferase domain-containing protein [Roseiflexaceae bacterium]|nr:nucleotidyltransferase domain-containing protein [Roseiflexaceae bacterium]